MHGRQPHPSGWQIRSTGILCGGLPLDCLGEQSSDIDMKGFAELFQGVECDILLLVLNAHDG